MKQDERATRNEHFIPKSYLKAFAIQNKKQVFQYDLTGKVKTVPTPIKSICYCTDLYEVVNSAGEYIQRNEIEKLLQKYETNFCKTRKNILDRINCINPGSTQTITPKEYKTICEMIAIQICRMPQSIEIAKQQVQKFLREDNPEQSFVNMLALAFLLPLDISAIKDEIPEDFKVLTHIKNNPPLAEEFLQRMKGKKYAIGYAPKGNIPAADLPIFISRDLNCDDTKKMFDFDLLLYPLSPTLAFFMWSDAMRSNIKTNEMFVLQEKHITKILQNMATAANRWLYSKKRLNKKEKRIVSDARRIKLYEPYKQYDGILYK